MNLRKFLTAALGYIVVTFVFAAGWHLILFKELYDQLGIFTRKEPLIYLGFISMILQGFVLAFVYPYFGKHESPVRDGLRFGVLMGVFLGSSAVFAEAGKQEVSSLSTWILLESIYYLLQFSVVGMVIGSVYGRPAVRIE